jgi:hypothetical protein
MTTSGPASWNDTATRAAIVDFVERVTTERGPDFVPPSERIAASAITYAAEPDVFDDGPVKPIRIWIRIGRCPILAGGNSNGDIPMLRYTGGKDRPALRLLGLHDDAEREFDHTAGAERSLETAAEQGWTVVSIKNDWATVFT